MTWLVVALALAGCGTRPAAETPLEDASIAGRVDVGDDFVFEGARMLVSHEDVSAADAFLAEPHGLGSTALQRDRWVLEVRLRESAPGAARGDHDAQLTWNGRDAGAVLILQGVSSAGARGATLRYDLGGEILRANSYTFEVFRTS